MGEKLHEILMDLNRGRIAVDKAFEQIKSAMCEANAQPQLCEVAPKTEIRDPDTLHRYYMCPNSKCFGGFKAIKRDFEYCPYCGVKLSWRNFV